LTVALIVLGAICEQLLKEKQILVCSRVLSLGDIKDDANSLHFHQAQILCQEPFPVVHEEAKKNMMKAIEEAKNNQDSLGAIIQTSAFHLPVGLGNPFFDSFESILSHLLFSIPGVKGVEFGLGFDLARMFGSQANDQMAYEDGKVSFYTNHAGGINGGLTNGNPLVFQTAFRPTPSIGKAQNTIDVKNHTNKELHIKGRHDVVFAIKGLHVINAITNYAILEMLLEE
jgi:chorismate synthase